MEGLTRIVANEGGKGEGAGEQEQQDWARRGGQALGKEGGGDGEKGEEWLWLGTS